MSLTDILRVLSKDPLPIITIVVVVINVLVFLSWAAFDVYKRVGIRIIRAKKTKLELMLDTPEGLKKAHDYKIVREIRKRAEQEYIQANFPGRWEIVTEERYTAAVKITPLGGISKKDIIVIPEIKFAVLNKGPNKAHDIHVTINFPETILIRESGGVARHLLDRDTKFNIKDRTAHFAVDSLHTNFRTAVDEFYVELPKKDGAFSIEYSLVADEGSTEGELVLNTENHFKLVKIIDPFEIITFNPFKAIYDMQRNIERWKKLGLYEESNDKEKE